MRKESDFHQVTHEFFTEKLETDAFQWSSEQPKDIGWREAHIMFVVDTNSGKTVGFRRTSSYGAPDEYYLYKSI